MNLDLSKIIQKSYWLQPLPPRTGNGVLMISVVVGILFILSIMNSFMQARHPIAKLWRNRLGNWLWTCTFVGALLLFFRWQQLPVLSTRVFAGVFNLIALVWLIIILIWRAKQFPIEMNYYNRQKTFEKYLPRNND